MSSTVQAPDLLAAIVAATRRIIEVRSGRVSTSELGKRASQVTTRPGAFRSALGQQGRINVIAECKRRSPSRGTLRGDYDPADIAMGYERAGAAAISVLTEPTFFGGSLEHLEAVRRSTPLPLLRKDFVIDPYQILEARAAGADAVLLIVSALTPDSLTQLQRAAIDAGLDVLVEVHNLAEVPVAVDAGASIIGVNNRDLRTLAVDTDVSLRAGELIPDDIVSVAESGLKSGADLARLRQAGYDAFLIGERFMTTDHPGSALRDLLADVS